MSRRVKNRKYFKKVRCRVFVGKSKDDAFCIGKTLWKITHRLEQNQVTIKSYQSGGHTMIMHLELGKECFDDILQFAYHIVNPQFDKEENEEKIATLSFERKAERIIFGFTNKNTASNFLKILSVFYNAACNIISNRNNSFNDPDDKKTYNRKKQINVLAEQVKQYAEQNYIIYLLGYSYTCGICARVATMFPKYIRKLIFISPTLYLLKTKLLMSYLKQPKH